MQSCFKQRNSNALRTAALLQIGFRMFLSASAAVSSWNADNTACNLVSPCLHAGAAAACCFSLAMHTLVYRFWRTILWWTLSSCLKTAVRSSTAMSFVASSEGLWKWYGVYALLRYPTAEAAQNAKSPIRACRSTFELSVQ